MYLKPADVQAKIFPKQKQMFYKYVSHKKTPWLMHKMSH